MSTILPTTTYTGSATVTGNRFKGDGYYGRQDGLHTVAYFLNGFVGVVKIQATLVADPADTDWFDVTDTDHGDGSTIVTANVFKNFTGNFVWIRAVVTEFSSGTIDKIHYNH